MSVLLSRRALFLFASLCSAQSLVAQTLKPKAPVVDWLVDADKLNSGLLNAGVALPSGLIGLVENFRVVTVDATKRVRVVGGKGEGPGEFGQGKYAGVSGDSMWVGEGTFRNRVTLFGPTGNLVRTFTTPSEILPPRDAPHKKLASLATVVGVHPGDQLLFEVKPFTDGVVEAAFWEKDGLAGGTSIVRTAKNGSFLNLVVRVPSASVCTHRFKLKDQRDSDGWEKIPIPFCWAGSYGVSGNSAYAVAAVPVSAAGKQPGVSISLHRPDGTRVYQKTVHFAPVPVPKAIRDSAVEFRVSSVAGPPIPGYRDAVEAMPIPAVYPQASSVRVGNDGSVWVATKESGTRKNLWVVYDQSGNEAAVVMPPSGLKILQVEATRFWGMLRDDDGLESLIRYRVVK